IPFAQLNHCRGLPAPGRFSLHWSQTMLQTVQIQHVQALLGQQHTLYLPDGTALPIHIEYLDEVPAAKTRYSERMPFCLEFNSLVPTGFVDGLCALEL